MDCHHYNTELPERKRGQHLQREERGVIQALKQQGLSNRTIARELKCSPTSCGVAHRRASRTRGVLRATAPRTGKLCTDPIGSVPGNPISCFPAGHSCPR